MSEAEPTSKGLPRWEKVLGIAAAIAGLIGTLLAVLAYVQGSSTTVVVGPATTGPGGLAVTSTDAATTAPPTTVPPTTAPAELELIAVEVKDNRVRIILRNPRPTVAVLTRVDFEIQDYTAFPGVILTSSATYDVRFPIGQVATPTRIEHVLDPTLAIPANQPEQFDVLLGVPPSGQLNRYRFVVEVVYDQSRRLVSAPQTVTLAASAKLTGPGGTDPTSTLPAEASVPATSQAKG